MPGAVAERLLEREHEIARLSGVLEATAAGAGTAILAEGAPGIGKTSLLDVAADLAAAHGLAVLRARGGELEQALAFGVARDLLARRVAQASEELRERLGTGASRVALQALGLGEPQFPPAEEAAINHGLTWLVTDLADEQPLELIVDDVQWSDAASVAWLAHLSRRIADLPAALVMAARPAAGSGEAPGLSTLRDLPDLERLRLRPLAQSSVAALVRSFYAVEAEDQFVAACHTAAGGNPFHTHALLDAAAVQEIPATAAGADALAELAPDAVRRSVSAALRRAGPHAKALAQACAILGESVDLRHATELADLDQTAGSRAADRLAEQNMLIRARPLSFVHPVLLAAVRDALAPGERNDLHRFAAGLFGREGDTRRAAAHLLEVEPARDPAVVHALVAAAGQAVSEGAVAHAARLLERALAEPPAPEQRPFLLGLLGKARFQSHSGPAQETLLAAAEIAASEEERAELFAYAGFCDVFEGVRRLDEVARRIDAASLKSTAARLRVDGMLGMMTRLTGRAHRPATTELIARSEPLTGASLAETEFLAATVVASDIDVALPSSHLARLALRALSHPEIAGAGAAFNGGHIVVGAPDEILHALDASLAECERSGVLAAADAVLQARAGAYYVLGRLREAEADIRLLWERSTDDSSFIWSGALSLLLAVMAGRGLIEDANELMALHRPFPEGELVHEGLKWGAGMVALEAGDTATALRELLDYERALEQRGWHAPPALPTSHLPTLVEALVHNGDLEAARAFAEKELNVARAREAPGGIGFALRTKGLAVGRAEGRKLIEEGVALLEQSPERAHLARALLDLGRALRLGGKPREARAPLRRAMELAAHCGAELVAQRAFDELRATGAKPRRRALSGPDSLTASEARIARLATEGKTNREIAQTLYVTAKTVETHLGHTYAKLGITGRNELAAALRPSPPDV